MKDSGVQRGKGSDVAVENVISIEKARELAGNAVLWPRVRDFLWDFAPQVHESWLAGMPGLSAASGVLRNAGVKRYVLEQLGVEPCFHSFPADDGSRLLLLGGETLLETAKWLGAAACADVLRKITDGATVKALKASFPGVYPEVFGYTMYFDFKSCLPFAETEDRNGLDGQVLAAGYDILTASVGTLPAPLLCRLKLMLPKSLGGPRDGKDAPRIAFQTVLKLLKLKFPEAYSLCCS